MAIEWAMSQLPAAANQKRKKGNERRKWLRKKRNKKKILRSQKGREGGRAKMSHSSFSGVALHSALQKVLFTETLFLP